MKISKLFHTLYAFLMFLPVMVLPLFAININQKELEPLTAQIEETKVVNFNQLINIQDKQIDNLYVSSENGLVSFNGIVERSFFVLEYSELTLNHDFLLKLVIVSNPNNIFFRIGDLNAGSMTVTSTDTIRISTNGLVPPRNIGVEGVNSGTDLTGISFYFNVFDLTQMFGSDNVPTIQQFTSWYPNDYYEYTTGRKEILYTGIQDTLNNTDVGSQFLYSLYNPLKDYFNLPNYMNLGGLYDWFLVNLFSGYNSPVYFIIFDLIIYWLAMSLLWLIFDVLMYVPSMIHKMLDKARME